MSLNRDRNIQPEENNELDESVVEETTESQEVDDRVVIQASINESKIETDAQKKPEKSIDTFKGNQDFYIYFVAFTEKAIEKKRCKINGNISDIHDRSRILSRLFSKDEANPPLNDGLEKIIKDAGKKIYESIINKLGLAMELYPSNFYHVVNVFKSSFINAITASKLEEFVDDYLKFLSLDVDVAAQCKRDICSAFIFKLNMDFQLEFKVNRSRCAFVTKNKNYEEADVSSILNQLIILINKSTAPMPGQKVMDILQFYHEETQVICDKVFGDLQDKPEAMYNYSTSILYDIYQSAKKKETIYLMPYDDAVETVEEVITLFYEYERDDEDKPVISPDFLPKF